MLIKSGWTWLVALAYALSLAACTPRNDAKNDPKGRLAEYISHSFSIKKIEERDELLSFMTGEAKTRLAAWSEEQFRQAFMDSKRQFLKLLITEVKNVSPTETNLTYELSYVDQTRDAKITQKKLCQMILQDGRWMISGVNNIKELVEYRNEMSLP